MLTVVSSTGGFFWRAPVKVIQNNAFVTWDTL